MTQKYSKYGIVGEDFFTTPDMGEFITSRIKYNLGKELSTNLNEHTEYQYYIEAPFSEEAGYHKEQNVLLMYAKPSFLLSQKAEAYQTNNNKIDGDTLRINLEDVTENNQLFTPMGSSTQFAGIKDYLRRSLKLDEKAWIRNGNPENSATYTGDKTPFSLRFLGIDCPELPHYNEMSLSKIEKYINEDSYKGLFAIASIDEIISKGYIRSVNSLTRVSAENIAYSKIGENSKGQFVTKNTSTKRYFLISKAYNRENEKNEISAKEVLLPEDFSSYDEYFNSLKSSNRTFDLFNNLNINSISARVVQTCSGELNDLEYFKQAKIAQAKVVEKIKNADKVLFMCDCTVLNKKSGTVPFAYRSEGEKIGSRPFYAFKSLWNQVFNEEEKLFKYLGYSYFGQDLNGRLLGACYLKKGDIWINLGKYIAHETSKTEVLPSFSSNPSEESEYGYISDAFKLYSYKRGTTTYLDIMSDTERALKMDDRAKIQKDITGMHLSDLKDYTVMLGDCLLTVPPTSIRLVSQTTAQRVSLLRTKGSITKQNPNSERILEMNLYFNGEEGINGVEYKQKLPNKDTATYYMNGLRALIAQFKFTPFLPISNNYINNVLNIEAVALNAISIETVPGFPRLIQATLKLQEFAYRHYMPELATPDPTVGEDLYTNTFSKTIFFPLMRYYYQKAINLGESIKDLNFNSQDYIVSTLGQKTALQPMKFKDSSFDLYLANEEFLKMKKQAKIELEKNPLDGAISFNSSEEDFILKLINSMDLVIDHFHKIDNSGDINKIKYKNKNVKITELAPLQYLSYTLGSFYNTFFLESKYYDSYHTLSPNFSSSKIKNSSFYYDYLYVLKEKMKEVLNNEKFDKSLFNKIEFATYHTKTSGGILAKEYVNIHWGLKFTPNWEKSGTVNICTTLREFLQKDSSSTFEYFKDNSIFISFKTEGVGITSSNLQVDKGFSIDKSTESDYGAITRLRSGFGNSSVPDLGDGWQQDNKFFNSAEDLEDISDNIELETDRSMVFDKYYIGDKPIINSFSLSYNNIFSNLSLKAIEGRAPQYCGGSDITIDIDMTTQDETTVSQLQALDKICTQRIIDYRKILSSSPIRIDSEFTRLCGVHEVLIDSLDISTVPSHPGVYNIAMRLISVDRTIRNKEALKKLDNINNSSTPNDTNDELQKGYFDLQNALAKVDLYPDLELPTIDELEKIGYAYLEYKTLTNRRFPDADFYFAYNALNAAEFYRAAIVKYFEDEGANIDTTEYSGNLFKDNYSINVNSERSEFKNKYGSLYSYQQNVGNAEADEQLKEIYSKVFFDKINYNENGTASDKVKKATERSIDYYNKSLDLQETFEAIKYGNAEILPLISIGARDVIPFGQNSEDRLGKRKCKTFKKDKKGNFYSEYEEKEVENYEQTINKHVKELILEILSKPIDEKNMNYSFFDNNSPYSKLLQYIVGYVMKLTRTTISPSDYLSQGQNAHSKNMKLDDFLKAIIDGVLVGRTAKAVYNKKENKTNDNIKTQQLPETYIVVNGKKKKRIYHNASIQDINGQQPSITKEQIENSNDFGPASIMKYSSEYIGSFYGSATTHNYEGFLDPYYNKQLAKQLLKQDVSDNEMKKRLETYKTNLTAIKDEDGKPTEHSSILHEMKKPNYSRHAIFRIMLCYFYKLLDIEPGGFLPTGMVLAGTIDNLSEIKKSVKDGKKNDSINFIESIFAKWKWSKSLAINTDEEKADYEALQNSNILLDVLSDIEDSLELFKLKMFNGLFFLLGGLAVGDKDTPLRDAIVAGNIEPCKTYFENLDNSMQVGSSMSNTDLKMFRYFIAVKRNIVNIDASEYYKGSLEDANKKINSDGRYQKLYIEAAERAQTWVMHSFYNMVMHNKRGTMSRAFPTYYMVLIDEGREYGEWRLQDNFYDVSAISEFQVVRSRKIAADTAKIVMTNLFGTFTTDDENVKALRTHTVRDVWNSIWYPEEYVSKESIKREKSPELNRARLKPGSRLHLRLGYSGDASSLPIAFNGVIAELEEGDLMTLVCQGDGIELDNPGMFMSCDANDVEDIADADSFLSFVTKFFSNNSTPKEICLNPLITEGSFLRKITKKWSNGRFFSSNPFGIVHFGSKRYTQFFENGEVEQNIYEAQNRPTWKTGGDDSDLFYEYELTEPPKIRMPINSSSTYWELMHAAANLSPDYIASTELFGLRSTIFMGHPRYYYAYEYRKNEQGKTVEKRKPFQQYHIITSYSDIIDNKMVTSNKDIRTVAYGNYKGKSIIGSKNKMVGPLFVDFDIYPENQKATTIDCGIEFKATDFPFTIPFYENAIDEWSENGGYQLAWRVTANKLKETMLDMYSGEVIIMGDTCIKPYDMICMHDIYEGIQGNIGVESVVHTFSVETGFTTSITPDLIAAVDNKYEQVKRTMLQEITGPTVAAHIALCTSNIVFGNITKPLMLNIANKYNKLGEGAANIISSIGNTIGKEGLANHGKLLNNINEAILPMLGLTKYDFSIYNSLNAIKSSYNALSTISKSAISNGKTLSSFFNSLKGVEDDVLKIKNTELHNEIKNAGISNKNGNLDNWLKESNEINNVGKQMNEVLNNRVIDSKTVNQYADDLIKEIDKLGDTVDKKSLNSLIDNIKGFVKNGDVKLNTADKNLMKNYNSFLDDLAKVSKYSTDISKDSSALKLVNMFKGQVDDVAKAGSKLKYLDNVFAGINQVTKFKGIIKSTLLKNFIGLALEMVITKSAQEYVERKLKNLQVLTVFPVIKNNVAWTAGLNGSKGMIVGSPSYNENGFVDSIASYMMNDMGIASTLLDIFFTTEEMRNTVNNYKRNNDYQLNTGSLSVNNTNAAISLTENIVGLEVAGNQAYKKLFYSTRIIDVKSDGADVFNSSSIYNIQDIQALNISNYNLYYILNDNDLLKYYKNKGFVINYGENKKEVKIGESNKQLTVISKYDAKDNVWDIPVLKIDALNVLKQLFKLYIKDIQPDYEEVSCNYSKIQEHPFQLINALRVNEKNSWYSTGYHFTIQVNNKTNFSNIIKELYTEQKEILSQLGKNDKVFNYKIYDSSKGIYQIFVYPEA